MDLVSYSSILTLFLSFILIFASKRDYLPQKEFICLKKRLFASIRDKLHFYSELYFKAIA